ncbi:RNase H family protein [Aliirhizobium cellulosilyticum]|uniref:Ribonuclease HI n=1 Tax=Aliirhizobium cellulosilyticum TaxID=393664 RepID=A0A7W6XBU5_9HYPH|nr:RNase H family protein [Rhizobium cellulosilyticum]MBB4349299.1 ribonuclease HI [Rhizobium cellulosilyticum]MBB4412479.1 ribonuclease HI [Rhizobium cellulosilyticum]MBB4447111.1 ribonuclease HI [Rhizobium cellulosilyticum]
MLELFTDGSYDRKTQIGGWAFVAYLDGVEKGHQCGSDEGDSNNSFEVLAALHAAQWSASMALQDQVLVWTDSFYVMEGVQRSLPIWRNNGWRKIDRNPRNRRRPSPDRDIWKRLDRVLAENAYIHIKWCKAHEGLVGNDRADFLAGASRLAHAAAAHRGGF